MRAKQSHITTTPSLDNSREGVGTFVRRSVITGLPVLPPVRLSQLLGGGTSYLLDNTEFSLLEPTPYVQETQHEPGRLVRQNTLFETGFSLNMQSLIHYSPLSILCILSCKSSDNGVFLSLRWNGCNCSESSMRRNCKDRGQLLYWLARSAPRNSLDDTSGRHSVLVSEFVTTLLASKSRARPSPSWGSASQSQ